MGVNSGLLQMLGRFNVLNIGPYFGPALHFPIFLLPKLLFTIKYKHYEGLWILIHITLVMGYVSFYFIDHHLE